MATSGINPSGDLQRFQSIAGRQDERLIFADRGGGERIGSLRNSTMGRVAVWLLKTLGAGQRGRLGGAYDRFSRAIRSGGLSAGEVRLKHADAVLAADRERGRPLTSRRVKQVLDELGATTPAGSAAGAPVDVAQQAQGMLVEAARNGIDAARNNLREISGDLHSAEDFLSRLRSGDSGLRRGTTGLSNLHKNLRPELLSPGALQGEPSQWREQSARVRRMAGQVAEASFNSDLNANLLQYGNSDNPFARVVKDFPHLDHEVRAWLATGFELADELLQAQERAGEGKAPLEAERLDELQRRVDAFANVGARTETPERPWSEEVLHAVFGDDNTMAPVGEAGGARAAPPHGPVSASLARSFDRAGAIYRLDQEVQLQREELRRMEGAGAEPQSADVRRARAELAARELSRGELVLGRDPRDALRAVQDDLAGQYGAEDGAVRAYADTVDYFSAAGAFAEPGDDVLAVPHAVDTSRTLADWRRRLNDVQARGEALRPRSVSERERAEALDDVSGFMQQAIAATSSRRDPRAELIRHAVDFESRRFADGGTGVGEASMLRAMAKEFTLLVEAVQGHRGGVAEQS